jgi:hypothetical protein
MSTGKDVGPIVVEAIERFEMDDLNHAYLNLAAGLYSVEDMAKTIEKVTGIKPAFNAECSSGSEDKSENEYE